MRAIPHVILAVGMLQLQSSEVIAQDTNSFDTGRFTAISADQATDKDSMRLTTQRRTGAVEQDFNLNEDGVVTPATGSLSKAARYSNISHIPTVGDKATSSGTGIQKRMPISQTNNQISPLLSQKPAQPMCGISPFGPEEIAKLVAESADRYGVDAGFAKAIAWTESRFDQQRNSSKGARGPMQLIPETAARFGVTDICDPVANIDGGMRYLRSLIDRFGNAIQLDPSDGTVALKLDFSLTKMGKRSQTVGEASDSSPVKNETKKLSLRALLHYLWHQGGLIEWTAYWSGKRHWHQVRSHLLEAARIMTAKGIAMSDRLYIPETFRLEDRGEIEQRRSAALADLYSSEPGPRKLMVLIGEVKEFAAARNGCKMIVRHMPGFPLMLEDAAFRRLQSRYEAEFALWDSSESAHLMAIATFGMAPSGIVNVEEIALMTVTEQWIPIETVYEERLVQRLARLSLKSVKCLRFNLSASQPFAAATLTHRRPLPAALYIVPPSADEAFRAELAEMIEARPDMEPWIWNVADGDIPPLPV